MRTNVEWAQVCGKFMKSALLLWLLAVTQGAGFAAQIFDSEKLRFSVTPLIEGLEYPWSLAFLPDGRLLLTERAGRLRITDAAGRLHPAPIDGLPAISANGQGGLLDVVLHPDHVRNGWLYFAYVAPGPSGLGTEVARARLDGHRLHDVQTIFRMRPKSGGGRHFGSRLIFDRQGLLYITLGERGDQDRAQLPGDHAGSVIRLHDDGRVPQDNPFVGKTGYLPEKFTLGHRNIQGAALHPETGELWAHEHGPQGGDEINIIRAGTNYGWPVITYGRNYGTGTRIGEGTAKAGMAQPIWQWTPSIAPSGMSFVTSERYPSWRGNLLVGALRGETLVRLELTGERVVREERLLVGAYGRIRDVRIGPDGLIYLLTDSSNGKLLRIEPR